MQGLRNVLQMIFLLKDGRKIKVKEFAEKLEVSEKQIKRYKEVLQDFFDIESISGCNGGYQMKECHFPFHQVFKNEELMLLKYAINSLETENNKEISKIIDKLDNYIIKSNRININEEVWNYSQANGIDEKLIKTLDEITLAILQSRIINIDYRDNNGKESNRDIEPYKYLTYKGEKYLVANCLLRNKIRFFKVRRIIKYRVSIKRFNKTIDIDNYIMQHKKQRLGIYNEGEKCDLVLRIKNPISNTIKERTWIENQEIEENEDGSIIFKATVFKGPELISWILGMRQYVKILEPESLKNEIKKELREMINNI